MPNPTLTRARASRLAAPIVLANAVEPLAGVVDTAVVGATGGGPELGGVALGVTLVNVVVFTCYFLRMSTTGLAAQADGAGDLAETQRVLLRSVGLAAALGLGGAALAPVVAHVGFAVLGGAPEVEAVGARYLLVRALGFPFAFALFGFTGWLIALGRTRRVLYPQLAFSLSNIALDLFFVLGLELGAEGVAAATTAAHLLAAGVGFAQVRSVIRETGWGEGALERAPLLDREALRRLVALNADFVLRTWAMLIGFSWFADAGARAGTAELAANHVLLQIITFWAFVLDAFAFVAESEVGRALGRGSQADLRRAIRVTAELSLGAGLVFAAMTLGLGPSVIDGLVQDPAVRAAAQAALPWCAAVPLLGAPAWQLDGVFVGAARSRAMRNASVAAVALYVGTDLGLREGLGVSSVWPAFVAYYVYRALTLLVGLPRLARELE